MPPSSEPSFSTAGFDRQVPPLPPRPYRSRRMRERDAGRREEDGEGEEGETECTLRTVVSEQTDRWAKAYSGGGEGRPSIDGPKGLPLLGMQGTARLREKEELWLTAVLEYISSSLVWNKEEERDCFDTSHRACSVRMLSVHYGFDFTNIIHFQTYVYI